jgi:predicted metalloendopeptidase
VSWARVWCGASTSKFAHKALLTDVHSPSKWRIIGPLSNSDEFSKAFQCKKGSPMNPLKKCVVW